MHPLRLLLYGSLVAAGAVAWALAAALLQGGTPPSGAVLLGIAAFVVFLVPWAAVYFWAIRRASDLDELTERTRRAAEGALEKPVADRQFHGELDDLARGVEELRAGFARYREQSETHRAAMAEIVSSLGEGLIGVNRRGRIVVANRRVAEMFGSREDLIGSTVLEAVRKQSVAEALDKALQGEASADRIVHGDSQFEVRAFPVEASQEIAAVALLIDVTTIERLQRIRKDFLDDFSHEVRTPLAGLQSAAETFEHGGLTSDHETQLRQVIQRQARRIERLVNDLAELNQIESGQLVLQRREVNLRELLAELGADFGVDVSGGETRAFVDAARVQQIVTNLLDNARKHGDGEISVTVGAEDGEAVVSVSDRGPGIPPAELERIFNRFYRVDRSRSQPGTGLGLAIAKHLAAAHGGTIRAYNRAEGGGATFEVRLPLT